MAQDQAAAENVENDFFKMDVDILHSNSCFGECSDDCGQQTLASRGSADLDSCMSDRSLKRREMTNAERTLARWEFLLRNSPKDPMAFYWREMINWCKARLQDSDGDDESENDCIGSKRPPEPLNGQFSADLESLNVMVKRCRCNDDSCS